MKRARNAAFATSFAFVALSAMGSVAAQDDPRLVTVVYDPARVVKLHGRPGVQATISFGDDEKIENVAVGDSRRWQITPNKRANLLFARPLEEAATTNMTVVTDKRTYLFDLIASADQRPVYMLSFKFRSGPEGPSGGVLPSSAPQPVPASARQAVTPTPQPAPPATAQAKAPKTPFPQEAAPVPQFRPIPTATPPVVAAATPFPRAEPLVPPPAPEPESSPAEPPVIRSAVDEAIGASGLGENRRSSSPHLRQTQPTAAAAIVAGLDRLPVRESGAMNFAWIRKGKKSLFPRRVYDDGRTTFLIWDQKQKVPTVLVTDERGEEAPPNLTAHENSVAIAAVPGQIILRTEKSSATLENLRRVAPGAPIQGRLSAGQSHATTPSQGNE